MLTLPHFGKAQGVMTMGTRAESEAYGPQVPLGVDESWQSE
jgi:hypothetical protein